jgi:hypothetical protein
MDLKFICCIILVHYKLPDSALSLEFMGLVVILLGGTVVAI